jgi:hypothetical protein
MKNNLSYKIYWLWAILFFMLVAVGTIYAATQQATTTPSLCGNDVVDVGEACDGSDLDEETCQTSGFQSGDLSCNVNCTLNTSACTSNSGGGSAGVGILQNTTTKLTFSGRAYPGGQVWLLKDGQFFASTTADQAALFLISVFDLTVGDYIFSLYVLDNQNRRSPLQTFPVAVTEGMVKEINNIFIAPTIAVDKAEVKKGEFISVLGQSVPQAEVAIITNSEQEIAGKVFAGFDGTYLYSFDTSLLAVVTYSVRVNAALGGALSGYSEIISFRVGAQTVDVQPINKCLVKSDLNNDCRVNLVDFYIALYWYQRVLSGPFVDKESSLLNNDNKVDLIDFSIMAYYWTG